MNIFKYFASLFESPLTSLKRTLWQYKLNQVELSNLLETPTVKKLTKEQRKSLKDLSDYMLETAAKLDAKIAELELNQKNFQKSFDELTKNKAELENKI